MVLTINAGEGKEPARAKELLIAMDCVGRRRDLHQHQDRPGRHRPEPDGAGRLVRPELEHVTITNLQQVSRYTTAATFNLVGLRLKVNVGDDAKGKECFVETEPRPTTGGPLPPPAPDSRARPIASTATSPAHQEEYVTSAQPQHARAGGGPGRGWRSFRRWRRSRPFWGGLLTVLAGVEMFASTRMTLNGLSFSSGATGSATRC